jgi:hypothetical protein
MGTFSGPNIVDANMRRRDMNVGQKSMVALAIKDHLAIEAKKRQARKPAEPTDSVVQNSAPQKSDITD